MRYLRGKLQSERALGTKRYPRHPESTAQRHRENWLAGRTSAVNVGPPASEQARRYKLKRVWWHQVRVRFNPSQDETGPIIDHVQIQTR